MARVATRVAVVVAAAAAAAAVTTALPVAELPSTGRQFFKAQLGGIYTRFIAQGNCPARIEHTGFEEPSAGVVNVPFANIRMGGVPCTSAGSMVVVPNTDNTLTGRLSSLLESNEVLNAVYSQLVDSGAQFLVGFETVSRVCGPTTFAAPTVSFFVSEPEAISVPRVAFLRPDFRPYMMVFKTNSDDGIPCTYAKGDRQVDTGTVASGNDDDDDDDDDSDDDDGVTAVPVVVPVVTVDGADEASDSDDDDDGDADNNDGADVVVPVVVPVDGGDDDDSDDDDNDDDDDDSAAVTPVPVVVPAGGDDDATDSDDDDDDSSAVTPVPVVVPAGGDGDATDSDDDDDTSAVTPVPVVVPAGGDGDVTDSDDDDDTSAATPVPVIVDGTDDATDGAVDGADGTDSDTSDDEGPEPSDDDDSVCFPASAEVELESGATVTMDKLAVGDSVRVSADAFSRVFMFTHKVAAGSFNFVKLSTASAASLTVTRSHYIYANGKMTAAGAVRLGDRLELVAERKCDIVTAIASVTGTGLYNPQTLHGDIVVNGIRASTYTTAVEPTVASALLAPLRVLFRATGLSTSALDAGSARLAALLPSGASAY